MGKKSRMKRDRQPVPQSIGTVLAGIARSQENDMLRQGFKELAEALALEKAQADVDRINNTPLGDPINEHKIDLTFKPIEALLEEIVQTGDIDVNNKGSALFYHQGDQCWYPLVQSLTSMCDTFAKLASEFHWTDLTDGLRKLAKKLDVQMPLFQADIDSAHASIAWMRKQIRHITPHQFSDEAIVIQIRDEMAERMAA